MKKIWYIQINGQREGPLYLEDLKRDTRITPDTLVWRQGLEGWKPIREVPELQEVFEDKEPPPQIEPSESLKKTPFGKDELVLEVNQEPPYLLWLIIALLVLIYVIYQLY